MLKVEINNSTSRVIGLNNEQFSELKSILCYEADLNAAYFSGNFRSTRRYLIDRHGVFPTGLLHLVERYLLTDKREPSVRFTDLRHRPERRMVYSLTLPSAPYPEQIDAVEACLRANRGTVAAVTGFGKSICMALLIAALKMKTLVVVPNLELKRQLTESFTSYFGSLYNITIENIDSTTLNTPNDYDCLIIDEAHHVAAKTYRTLNKKAWAGIYYRFFFTATPFRSKTEEQMLYESVAGQVIYQIGYKDAVAKGYVTPIEAYYVDLPKTSTEAYTYARVYSELVVNNKYRNDIISDLLCSLTVQKIPTLCLVREINHGLNINNLMYHKFGYEVPFAKGENNDNKHTIDAFNNTDIKALIGTVGVLGEGVDTRPAEFVIIAGLGKSKNQFMQCVGRALRVCKVKETAKIIIFRDKSHKYTLRHFNMQVKFLREEYGVICQKLNV